MRIRKGKRINGNEEQFRGGSEKGLKNTNLTEEMKATLFLQIFLIKLFVEFFLQKFLNINL